MEPYTKFIWVYSLLAIWLLQPSQNRVYEGKNLVKFVRYKRLPTVLHATAGFNPAGDSAETAEIKPAFRIRSNGVQLYRKLEQKAIPGFILGARLFEQKHGFQDRILTKPKRWAVSTIYDPPVYHAADSKVVMDAPKIMGERIYPSENKNEQLLGEPVHDTLQYIPQSQPYAVPPARPWETALTERPESTEPEHAIFRSPAPWAVRHDNRPRQIACSQPLDRGMGPDEISSWYFDLHERRCRWFGYRGYGGNANRFSSRLSCENYCIRDTEDLCTTVHCSWRNTRCSLVGDQRCRHLKKMQGEDWRLKCPPDQPVCLSRLNTRMAPDVSSTALPTECYQPKDTGSCIRKNPFIRYYYDQTRNNCMQFYFHGCGGNDNRFETKSDCMTHCAP